MTAGARPSYDRDVVARFLFDAIPWRCRASCRDDPNPDRWFPLDEGVEGVEELYAICEACPVRVDCAKYVLRARIKDGVWAGFFIDPEHLVKSQGKVARWLRSNG